MGRMGFKHTIREDIDTFGVAEQEFQMKMQEKTDLDTQAAVIMTELEMAEKNVRDAEMVSLECSIKLSKHGSIASTSYNQLKKTIIHHTCVIYSKQELTEAKRRVEQAQLQLTESQSRITEVQRDLYNMNISVKKADQEVAKSDQHLRRKRDVVRRALKRKDEIYGGGQQQQSPPPIQSMFETGDTGVKLNSALDRSSMIDTRRRRSSPSSSNNEVVGLEDDPNIAQIEKLRKQEANIESEFLMLVEKASRLVSRSERLRLRSEALIGKQNDDDSVESSSVPNGDVGYANGGTVVGDNFGGDTL